jgi:hypothetical protein
MLANSTYVIHNFTDQTDQPFSVLHLSVFVVLKKNAISDPDGSDSLLDLTQLFVSLSLSFLGVPSKNFVVLHCFMIG